MNKIFCDFCGNEIGQYMYSGQRDFFCFALDACDECNDKINNLKRNYIKEYFKDCDELKYKHLKKLKEEIK